MFLISSNTKQSSGWTLWAQFLWGTIEPLMRTCQKGWNFCGTVNAAWWETVGGVTVMSQKPADFFLTPSCSWSESQCSPTGRGRPTWFWFWWGFLPVKGEFLLGSLIATLITTNRNVFSLHSRLVHALDGGSDQTEVSVQSVGFLLRKRF